MRKNPLTDRTRRSDVYTNAYGVPTIGSRVRPAGDWIDEMIAREAAAQGSGSSNSGSDALPTAEELASIAADSGQAADIPPGQLSDNERARIANQNVRIIGMASQAIGETGQTIRAAITSGNAVEIERIRQAGQLATARALGEFRQATRAGDTAGAEAARTRAEQAAVVSDLMARLNAQNAPKGLSTQTMLLIGAGLAVVGGGVYLAMRPASRARNPVMVRAGKDGKPRRRFVNSKKVAHARALGWRKAR